MNDLLNFLKRIDFANDGLIKNIIINEFDSVEIILSVHDFEFGGKFIFTIILDSISDIKIPKNVMDTMYVVLSDGIQIYKKNDSYYVDLNPADDYPQYNPAEDLKYSGLYFIGKNLKYTIEKYK